MPQYRKKPVIVEAMQWNGENTGEILTFCHHKAHMLSTSQLIVVCTMSGVLSADIGDYIIRGVEGDYYPCKKENFEKTYERVENG